MPLVSHIRASHAAGSVARAGRPAVPPPLGNWQPVAPIHRGGLADVFRARPIGNEHTSAACYALKVLKPQWHEDAAVIESLGRETLAARSAASPHVISVFDWHLAEPPYFLVMPLLEGRTLAQHLQRHRPLATSRAVWIARQIAQGLVALHASGWRHADVKPANIFLSPEGHVTLIDLGLAQPHGQPRGALHHAALGTIPYMAPECFISSLSADVRSDLYGVGVTFYEMLTGVLPHEGRNPAEIMALQRRGVPDRLRCLNPFVPSTIVRLIRELLANQPERRPASAEELVRRLVAMELDLLGEVEEVPRLFALDSGPHGVPRPLGGLVRKKFSSC